MRTTRHFPHHLIAVYLSAISAAHAEDLLDIYRLARENDPAIRAATAAYAAAQEARPKSLSLLLPQVSATANASRVREEISNSAGLLSNIDQSFSERGYGLDLVQSIYNHSYHVQLRQADSRLAKAEADYGAAQQDLILRAARSYFDVLAADQDLVFARSDRYSLGERLDQTMQRYEAGANTLTLVLEVQASYDLAVANEVTAINALYSAREGLRALTGVVHEELHVVAEGFPLEAPEPHDMTPWVQLGQRQNLKLLAAQATEQIAREEVARQSAGHLPSLDLVVSHRVDAFGGGGFGARDSTISLIGVRLNVPLLSGGLVSALAREAAQLYIQATEQRVQTQRAVERAVRDAYRAVLASISMVRASKQGVTFNEAALEAVQTSYEAGKRTIQDVHSAQSNLYRAKRNYAEARHNYLLNVLQLKEAVGALAPGDLEQVNAFLTAPVADTDNK
jgi:outer membrane protein